MIAFDDEKWPLVTALAGADLPLAEFADAESASGSLATRLAEEDELLRNAERSRSPT
jgi:hypothetical protein